MNTPAQDIRLFPSGPTVFQIKICGVTTPDDAHAAIEAGADAIGLNFYEESPRYVSRQSASKVLAECGDVEAVGVFVNMPAGTLQTVANQVGLTAIQLHGDESPEYLAGLADLRAVRARRIGDRGLSAIAEDLIACRVAGRVPDAILVDAFQQGCYGGTGETLAWEKLAGYRRELGDVPLILADGLTPENVASAISAVQPAGVDVAGGVERSPGVKDHAKVRAFVVAARAAFAAIQS